MSPLKKCPCCLIEKDFSEFSKDKRRKSGLYIYCRSCSSQKNKNRYLNNLEHNRCLKRVQASKNKDKNNINSREWYQKNKGRVNTNVKIYRAANLDKFKEYQKKWNSENPEKLKEKQRRFLQSPKGKIKSNQDQHNRKALLRGAAGSHTSKEWISLKKMYGGMCVFCQRSEPDIKITRDHIIPISRGGSNCISNIQPLCTSCNSKKNNHLIERQETYLLYFDTQFAT